MRILFKKYRKGEKQTWLLRSTNSLQDCLNRASNSSTAGNNGTPPVPAPGTLRRFPFGIESPPSGESDSSSLKSGKSSLTSPPNSASKEKSPYNNVRLWAKLKKKKKSGDDRRDLSYTLKSSNSSVRGRAVSTEALEEGMSWYHVRARFDRRWRRHSYDLRTSFFFLPNSFRLQILRIRSGLVIWIGESEREEGARWSGAGFRPVYSIIRPGQEQTSVVNYWLEKSICNFF